jgi:membrane glycosyltransferase
MPQRSPFATSLSVPRSARGLRAGALGLAALASLAATLLYLQAASTAGFQPLEPLRAALVGVTTFWLAWGAVQGLLGLLYRERRVPRLADGEPIRGRTAILMPICREDPQAVFARLAAIDASLAPFRDEARIDVAVLSDTRDEALATQEAFWFARLVETTGGAGRMFYRRRSHNAGRKAGNIAEFFARSGGAYDYALILDADSLMEGGTVVEMIRRMEADPGLGLLQTLPRVVGGRSLFARAMQFSAALYSPIFSRGLAAMQGGAGPFWGHNALVRVRAFAESCHLPELSGPPPFGGHVLSHDYVEAALLVRGGWRVRLDPDLDGSYEEGPEDMLEHAKRDRRWCQGNLQYLRLLGAPGLAPWSRWVLLQGILSYVMPLGWLLLLLTAVPTVLMQPPPDYFPEGGSLFPVFPSDETAKMIGLLLGIAALLVAPKIAILAKALLVGAGPRFGGGSRAALSVAGELALTSLMAPVFLMFQTRAVAQVLAGVDGGWPANARGRREVSLALALEATWWIVLAGAAGLGAVALWAPDLTPWALPVTLPMILAPLVVAWTSHPVGRRLFRTRDELDQSPVLGRAESILAGWRRPAPILVPLRAEAPAASHG